MYWIVCVWEVNWKPIHNKPFNTRVEKKKLMRDWSAGRCSSENIFYMSTSFTRFHSSIPFMMHKDRILLKHSPFHLTKMPTFISSHACFLVQVRLSTYMCEQCTSFNYKEQNTYTLHFQKKQIMMLCDFLFKSKSAYTFI